MRFAFFSDPDKGHAAASAEALSWVVTREVTKRGGSDDLARVQADAAVRALGGQWSWGLEAQLWRLFVVEGVARDRRLVRG